MNVLGVIPARYSSTRFPGKLLEKIGDKSVLQHTYERACRCESLSELLIATSDNYIAKHATETGMHFRQIRRCTGGPFEVAAVMSKALHHDLVAVLPGDQPFIDTSLVERAVNFFASDGEVDVISFKCRIESEREFRGNQCTKTVTNDSGRAIYFSRAPVPFGGWPGSAFRSIGPYVFKRDILLRWLLSGKSEVYKSEDLDQIPFLEMGVNYWLLEAVGLPADIDTPDDLAAARKYFERYND